MDMLKGAKLLARRVQCGASSCPGHEIDPDFPPAICELPRGHEGMHSNGRCSWETISGAARPASEPGEKQPRDFIDPLDPRLHAPGELD